MSILRSRRVSAVQGVTEVYGDTFGTSSVLSVVEGCALSGVPLYMFLGSGGSHFAACTQKKTKKGVVNCW